MLLQSPWEPRTQGLAAMPQAAMVGILEKWCGTACSNSRSSGGPAGPMFHSNESQLQLDCFHQAREQHPKTPLLASALHLQGTLLVQLHHGIFIEKCLLSSKETTGVREGNSCRASCTGKVQPHWALCLPLAEAKESTTGFMKNLTLTVVLPSDSHFFSCKVSAADWPHTSSSW